MKETLLTVAIVIIVGISGLALANMVKGGSCCSVHHHQM